VAGQPGHRREGIGGPAEKALEAVRDGGRDVPGQPDADEVGEERAVGLPEIHVSNLPARQQADSAHHVQRDAQRPGEVVRGAERQHAQGDVPAGQVP
jgi:hypothetical protein